jgi:hypothetical protein
VSSLHPVLHPVTAVVTWSMNTQRYGHISHQVIYRLYILIYLAPSICQSGNHVYLVCCTKASDQAPLYLQFLGKKHLLTMNINLLWLMPFSHIY